ALRLRGWGWAKAPVAGLPPGQRDDLPALREKVAARAREQLAGPLHVPETTTPRDCLKGLLEELTAVLQRAPDDVEVRLLRARASRRAGGLLAANEDLAAALRRDPHHPGPVTAPLRATYQRDLAHCARLNEPRIV